MSVSKAASASSGSPIMRNPNWATLCLSNSREVSAPVSGTVVDVNSALADSPGLINEDPSGKGWFLKIKLSDAAEIDSLMDEDAYREFLKAVS
jgi:glycine cleavage system H lipoate-binding protein